MAFKLNTEFPAITIISDHLQVYLPNVSCSHAVNL